MPQMFRITAELQVQGPANLRPVVQAMKNQLGGVSTTINAQLAPGANRNIASFNANVQQTQKSLGTVQDRITSISAGTAKLSSSFAQTTARAERFGEVTARIARSWAAYFIGVRAVGEIANAFQEATKEAIDFQREMVRIGQVGGDSANKIQSISDEITRLSTKLGVSSRGLSEVSTTLRQAGLSADDTRTALGALAKTQLAPTFKSINNTVEGSIALMQQFGIQAKDLEKALGAVNTVAGQFAVESEDLVTVIRKAGGAFKAAAGDFQAPEEAFHQLLAVFTSVRQTTRESADEISTGLRTIFGRLQDNRVTDNLKKMGINLRYTAQEATLAGQNIEGRFVGALEAVRRLHEATRDLPTTSPRFAAIAAEIGGYRQISRVIPLLQQFGVTQRALAVAQGGSTSLTRDATKAQEAWATQFSKVREEFNAFVRDLSNDKAIQAFVSTALTLTKTLIQLANVVKPLLPLLATMAAIRLGQSVRGFTTGLGHAWTKFSAPITPTDASRKAIGGVIPGTGSGDKVPMMAEPGSYVIRKSSAKALGYGVLSNVDKLASGGGIRRPILTEPGEYFYTRSEAQKIGYGKLQRINQHARYQQGGSVTEPISLLVGSQNDFGGLFIEGQSSGKETSISLGSINSNKANQLLKREALTRKIRKNVTPLLKKTQTLSPAGSGYRIIDEKGVRTPIIKVRLFANPSSHMVSDKSAHLFRSSITPEFGTLVANATHKLLLPLEKKVDIVEVKEQARKEGIAALEAGPLGHIFESSLAALSKREPGSNQRAYFDFVNPNKAEFEKLFTGPIKEKYLDAKLTASTSTRRSLLEKATKVAASPPAGGAPIAISIKDVDSKRIHRIIDRQQKSIKNKEEKKKAAAGQAKFARGGFVGSFARKERIDIPHDIHEASHRVRKVKFTTGGSLEDLSSYSTHIKEGMIKAGFQRMLASEHGPSIASHVPKGSRFLAHGTDAIVFSSPEGHVIRIGGLGRENATKARPVDPLVLQATHTTKVGPHLVEHLPFVPSLRQQGITGNKSRARWIMKAFSNRLRRQGKKPTDVHLGNLGRYKGSGRGRIVAIDPEVYQVDKSLGSFSPTAEHMAASARNAPTAEFVPRSGKMARGGIVLPSFAGGGPTEDLLQALAFHGFGDIDFGKVVNAVNYVKEISGRNIPKGAVGSHDKRSRAVNILSSEKHNYPLHAHELTHAAAEHIGMTPVLGESAKLARGLVNPRFENAYITAGHKNLEGEYLARGAEHYANYVMQKATGSKLDPAYRSPEGQAFLQHFEHHVVPHLREHLPVQKTIIENPTPEPPTIATQPVAARTRPQLSEEQLQRRTLRRQRKLLAQDPAAEELGLHLGPKKTTSTEAKQRVFAKVGIFDDPEHKAKVAALETSSQARIARRDIQYERMGLTDAPEISLADRIGVEEAKKVYEEDRKLKKHNRTYTRADVGPGLARQVADRRQRIAEGIQARKAQGLPSRFAARNMATTTTVVATAVDPAGATALTPSGEPVKKRGRGRPRKTPVEAGAGGNDVVKATRAVRSTPGDCCKEMIKLLTQIRDSIKSIADGKSPAAKNVAADVSKGAKSAKRQRAPKVAAQVSEAAGPVPQSTAVLPPEFAGITPPELPTVSRAEVPPLVHEQRRTPPAPPRKPRVYTQAGAFLPGGEAYERIKGRAGAIPLDEPDIAQRHISDADVNIDTNFIAHPLRSPTAAERGRHRVATPTQLARVRNQYLAGVPTPRSDTEAQLRAIEAREEAARQAQIKQAHGSRAVFNVRTAGYDVVDREERDTLARRERLGGRRQELANARAARATRQGGYPAPVAVPTAMSAEERRLARERLHGATPEQYSAVRAHAAATGNNPDEAVFAATRIKSTYGQNAILNRNIGQFQRVDRDERFTPERAEKAQQLVLERRQKEYAKDVQNKDIFAEMFGGLNLSDLTDMKTHGKVQPVPLSHDAGFDVSPFSGGNLERPRPTALIDEPRTSRLLQFDRSPLLAAAKSDFKPWANAYKERGIKGVANKGLGKFNDFMTGNASYALAMAPEIINQVTGGFDPQTGRGRTGHVIGGAIASATLGAQVGSLGGAPGTAIGAVVGALAGLATTIEDTNREIEDVKFGKTFEKANQALESVISGKTKATPEQVGIVNEFLKGVPTKVARDQNNTASKLTTFGGNAAMGLNLAGAHIFDAVTGGYANLVGRQKEQMAGIERGRATSRITTTEESFRNEIGPQLPALKQFAESIARETRITNPELLATERGGIPLSQEELSQNREARIHEFEARGGGQVAENVSRGMKININSFYDAIDKEIISANKEKQAREANIKAMGLQIAQTQSFTRIGQAITATANSMQDLQNHTASLQAAFEGSVQAIPIHSHVAAAQNVGGLDTDAFHAAVSHVTGALGGEGPDNPLIARFGQQARGLNKASFELPTAIRNAMTASGPGVATEDTPIASLIDQQLEKANIGQEIRQTLGHVILSIDPKQFAEDAATNVDKLSEDLLQKGFANVYEVLSDAAKQLEERANAFNQGLANNQAMINRIGESQDKFASLSLEAAQAHANVAAVRAGRPSDTALTVETRLRPLQQRQERLTGFVGAQANNPRAIAERLQQTHAQIEQVRQARDQATGSTQDTLSQELSNLQGNAQRLGQALENLADTSGRTAIIQEKLNKLEEDRQGRLSFTEKLITAGPQQLQEMRRGAYASDVAVQQGSFAGFSAENIQRALDHLQSLGNVRLPDYGGRAAGDVREQLLTNSGYQIGTLDPRAERQRVGLMQQQAKIADTGVEAQGYVVQNQQQLQQQFFTELNRTQEQFLDKLHTNLLEATRRDITSQTTNNQGEVAKTGAAQNALAFFQKRGLNFEQAQRLTQSEDFGRLGESFRSSAALPQQTSNLIEKLNANKIGGTQVGALQGPKLDTAARLFERSYPGITFEEANLALSTAGTDEDQRKMPLSEFAKHFQAQRASTLAGERNSYINNLSQNVFGTPTNQAAPKNIAKNITSLSQAFDETQKQAGAFEGFRGGEDIASRTQAAQTLSQNLQQDQKRVETELGRKRQTTALRPIVTGPTLFGPPRSEENITGQQRPRQYPPQQPILPQPMSPGQVQRATAQFSPADQYGRTYPMGSALSAAATFEQNRYNPPAPVPQTNTNRFMEQGGRQVDLETGQTVARRTAGGLRKVVDRRQVNSAALQKMQQQAGYVPIAQRQQQQQQQEQAQAQANKPADATQSMNALAEAMKVFNNTATTFATSINNLAKVFSGISIPSELTVRAAGKIEVVINGADTINKITAGFKEAVIASVIETMQAKLPSMVKKLPPGA